MVTLKKELILISMILVLVLAIAVVYASENGSNNNSKGNGNHGNYSEDNETEEDFDGENETNEELEENNETEENETEKDKKHKFFPWQKRNESECPEECECHGAVVSCETEDGKIMTITAGNSGKVITLLINKTEVDTELEIEQERDNETNKSKFHVKKSNGKKSQIKIMPDEAAERALERLRLKVCNESNNCTIVLKSVGKDEENETDNETIMYEMQIQIHAKILGIFQARAQERAEINAENGKIKIHQPWWMFLATKQD